MSNENAPIETPAAALIGPDPTGQTDVRYEILRELSIEDFERYKAAYRRLFDTLFASAYTYFSTSAKLFGQKWAEANTALEANQIRPNTDPDGFINWCNILRSATLTLCLSLVYHQHQTLQEVSDVHGNGSETHKKVSAIFGRLYDTYPAYRYLYGLRNIMAHDAMDAIALSATASLDENRKPVGIWDLKLDRSVICVSPKAKRELKDELASLEEDPSFLELLPQIAEPMRAAQIELLTVIFPDLTDVCRAVIEFDQIFEGRPGTRALTHTLSPEFRPGMRLSYTSWSGDAIAFAYRYEKGGDVTR